MGESKIDKEDVFIQAVDAFGDNKLEEAIEHYTKALDIDPNYQDALHGLARAQFDSGKVDEAINTAKRLTEIDADDPLAHTSLSMFYQRKGMIAEAEAEGAKARMLDWKRQLAEQADEPEQGAKKDEDES